MSTSKIPLHCKINRVCLIGLFFIFGHAQTLLAQNKPGAEIHIKKAKGEMKLDGILDESDWKDAHVAKDFFLNYPVDTAKAPFQTEVRMTFNEHFLYVSYVCYDDETPDMINSLRRDFDVDRNDNIGMNIGPYNDGINGFFFQLTPKGVQLEGTVSSAGNSFDSFNLYWDNKWYSKVVRYGDHWIAEMAIPFKSFRYKAGMNEWNIAFYRSDKKRNHKSSWIRTPIQYISGSFAYSGQLIWEDPIPPPHPNVSFIPFIAGGKSADNEAVPKVNSSNLAVGFDAKVGVTPSLNLDLTVNPDFSQVEVDQQVINLTRFEFKFPERRQFFLENSDLFDRAGFPEARTFFSRRIGLVKDVKTGLYVQVPIAFGARLSGSLNKKWRINVMNMQTKEKLSSGLPAQNFTVATIQRNFWRQSNFALTYVDKESLYVGKNDTSKYSNGEAFVKNSKNTLQKNPYNRVIDGDLVLLSKDNKWYHSTFFEESFNNYYKSQNLSGGTYTQFATRHWNLSAGNSFIQRNFNAEAGYVPSHGVYPGQVNYYSYMGYTFYPRNSAIVLMGPLLSFNHTYLPGGTLTDKLYSVGYNINFINTSFFTISANHVYQRLTNKFNPIDSTVFSNYLIGQHFNWDNVSATFQSNTRKVANLTMQATYGGFYNGHNLDINGQLNYRYQPYGNVSLRFDYNDVLLPQNYGREKLFLIGPRFDVTVTDKIFITTYVQYNKLLDNMNLNARFQWRYQPASDFFIVYTENYLPENFSSKNRALVFKLTYWLNI